MQSQLPMCKEKKKRDWSGTRAEKSYKTIKCLNDNLLLRKEIESVWLIQPHKPEVSGGTGLEMLLQRSRAAAPGTGCLPGAASPQQGTPVPGSMFNFICLPPKE